MIMLVMISADISHYAQIRVPIPPTQTEPQYQALAHRYCACVVIQGTTVFAKLGVHLFFFSFLDKLVDLEPSP